jgi:hypothetical protein
MPVNGIDALYTGMASEESASWKIIAQSGGYDFGQATLTISIDTSVVKPVITSPYFKWNGGYSDQTTYAIEDQGSFAIGASSVTPGRGSSFMQLAASFGGETAYSSTTEISGYMYDYPNLDAPITLQAFDSRMAESTAASLSGFTVYTWDQPDAEFSWARGTYAGGVWTPSDTGEDARIQVDATFSANTADYSVTGTVKLTATVQKSEIISITGLRQNIGIAAALMRHTAAATGLY